MDLTTSKNKQKKFFWMHFLTREFRFFLDVLILGAAFILAYLARFEFELSPKEIHSLVIQFLPAILIQFAFLFFFGAYSFFWRYFSLGEIKIFFLAFGGSGLVFTVFRLALPQSFQEWRIPLSIIFMDTVLSFGGVIGLRLLRRTLYEGFEKKLDQSGVIQEKPKKVLLIGAGQAAAMAIKEIKRRRDLNFEIKGLVDDDPKKQGLKIQEYKVLGSTEVLPYLVGRYEIEQVIITINNASRKDFQRILDICRQIPIKVLVIPSLQHLIQGEYKVSRIRDVQIEDLLGRDVVHLDEESIGRFISNRRVMVTGAGGSIGSELARQVARFRPAQLLLVERAEFALFEIDREMQATHPQTAILPLVADINDKERMGSIFQQHHPEIIFHAAAHKHVPMMERNPSEAIKNNCLGTRILGELADEYGVDCFVFISTDKAVNPTSVMGASKRLAEMIVQDLNQRCRTRFLAVRFGNVLGSSGSVINIFKDQILKGGPLTVTHPDMVRYFMTIPEAAQLVLQAGAISQGGEIFVLDMGEPVNILELAKEMVTLSGLKPYENIDIVCTGLRPGEKLFEELRTDEEVMVKTIHPKIYIGKITCCTNSKMKTMLEKLAFLSRNGHYRELKEYIGSIVPEACLTLDGPFDREVCLDPSPRGQEKVRDQDKKEPFPAIKTLRPLDASV
jgi:FlaA1/EpsC-like NDP-sugar epimerase